MKFSFSITVELGAVVLVEGWDGSEREMFWFSETRQRDILLRKLFK